MTKLTRATFILSGIMLAVIAEAAVISSAYQDKIDKRYIEQSCVPYNALHRYCYHDDAYFWHISDLKIYDKPKELVEFGKTRPPQSWCYVEEREEND